MQKIFTSLVLAFSSLAAMATNYSDVMTVKINGEIASNATTTISVDKQGDGSYKLKLADFTLTGGGNSIPVGTINITASGVDKGKYTLLHAKQDIQIENGSTGEGWIGPSLGAVPVSLLAKQTADKLYAVISINFQSLDIQVQFGGGYQVPNSDFELFTASNGEPDRWHSFKSASGGYASMVGENNHISVSNLTRPGSTGTHSVEIKAIKKTYFFVVTVLANGTLTTGRINAGATSAKDKKNNSFLDMSKADKDANGDPFYTPLVGRPDKLDLWVKFKQGKPNSGHPYATAKAVITDGTYYQLPEDKTYTNKMAEAITNTIESKGNEWQHLSIPFNYVNASVEPKAVLVTISTNATPGEGSNNDLLYVDDLSFVYDFGVKKISVKGEELSGFNEATTEYTYSKVAGITADDIAVETVGHGTIVHKEVAGAKATIVVASDDLLQNRVYTLNLTTGIDEVATVPNNNTVVIYDLNGVRVSDMNRSGVYILKDGKGNTRKVVKN